jgi:ribosome-associated translation inhibitor RaiA
VELPLQITFRDMPPSDALAAHVRKCASKLDRMCDRITVCRVAVEAPHRHHRHGRRYHVRIDLIVPGHEIVVARDPPANLNLENAHAAVDAAFDDAVRQLTAYTKKLHERRTGKPSALRGRSVEVEPEPASTTTRPG